MNVGITMYSIGIIGCGKQAEKHILGFKKNGVSGDKIYVSDVDETKAERISRELGVNYCPGVEDIFKNCGVDCIDICTPTYTHNELIIKSIDNGLHFFCEKPLTDSLKRAQNIRDRLQETKLIGMSGFIYKFAPAFMYGKSILGERDNKTSDTLGEVAVASFRIGGRGSHQRWKHRLDSGGGAINEMLVHMLDLALWYFGEIDAIRVISKDLLRPGRVISGQVVDVDAEDFVLVELKMTSGVRVYLQADMITPAFTQFVEIQGSNGSYFGSIQGKFPSYVHLIESRGELEAGNNPIDTTDADLYRAQLGYFLKCVSTNTQPDRSTVDESIYLMKIIEQIRNYTVN